MEVSGRVVVRTGYCKHRRERFALLPDFLIPRRRLSRLSLSRLKRAYDDPSARSMSVRSRIQRAIDETHEGLGDEFHLALSTAHSLLNLKFSAPP